MLHQNNFTNQYLKTMTQIHDAAWQLKSIRIDFQTWGEFAGKYTGKIEFTNKESEAFMFNLRPEMCEQYLHLIKDEMVGAASSLSNRLMQSLNLLPPPSIKAEIGTPIEHEEVKNTTA